MENQVKSSVQPKERFFDKRTCNMTILLILGTLIYCLGIVWFLNLGEFFAGGITGISQLLSYLFLGGVSPLLSFFIPMLNLPLFIIGWKHISKKFAFLTLISVVLQTIFIYLFQWLSDKYGFNPIYQGLKDYFVVLENGEILIDAGARLLLAFIGGFVCGVGNAMCLRSGGSSGGIDVVANALLVRKNISLTKISFIIDGTIVFFSSFVGNVSTALFTFVRFISSLMTIDRFYRIYQYIRIDVITEKAEEIREYVLSKFHHGITIYSVTGGFTLKEKYVLQIFASRYEMQDYLTAIKKIDNNAFMTVSHLTKLEGKYNKRTIL